MIFIKKFVAPKGGCTTKLDLFIRQHNLPHNSPRKIPIRLSLCVCLFLSISEFLFPKMSFNCCQYGRWFPERHETKLDSNNCRSRYRSKVSRKQLRRVLAANSTRKRQSCHRDIGLPVHHYYRNLSDNHPLEAIYPLLRYFLNKVTTNYLHG